MPHSRASVKIARTTHPRYEWIVWYTHAGKRKPKYFKKGEKGKAEAERRRMEMEVQRLGTEVVESLDDGERRLLVDAKKRLAAHGKSLGDALQHYLDILARTQPSITVGAATDECLAQKSREGKSARYQRDLEQKLFLFCRDFKSLQMADITTRDVSGWLQKLQDGGLAPVSIHCYRRALSVLFSHAVTNGYLRDNPAKHAFKPKVKRTIEILTPEEMKNLLEVAHPEILPVIALGGFAGLRRIELERLNWEDVDRKKMLIRLDAHQTKTATCRDVRIMPNLMEWLEPYASATGSVWPAQHERGRNLLEAALKAAGFSSNHRAIGQVPADVDQPRPWPKNALRHSFASYHYAMWEDAAKASAQMGHSEVNTFWAHYRRKASREAAEAFWAIRPVGRA